MRELIKTGAYSFADGSRAITITDGRSFTKDDILLIYNKTQNIPLYSVAQNDNITSVVGDVITLSNAVPVLNTGDVLSVQIDFPQNALQAPEHTSTVIFTASSVSFLIPQTGTLVSFDTAHDLLLRKKGAISYVGITLPYQVEAGDSLIAQCEPGCELILRIQLNATSGATINPGGLGTKVVTAGCNQLAHYSPAKNKIIIGGLAVYDEDEMMVVGDGYTTTGDPNGNLGYIDSYSARELDGFLYMYSAERISFVRVNLANKEVVNTSLSLSTAYQANNIRIVGGYLYSGSGPANPRIHIIDLASLAITNFVSAGRTTDSCQSYSAAYYHSGTSLYRLAGSTSSSIALAASYRTCYYNGNIYACSTTTVLKLNETDMSTVSSITTNPNATVSVCFGSNGYLYTLYTNGTLTKILLSTFVSPETNVNTGYTNTAPSGAMYTKSGVDYLAVISEGGVSWLRINLATGATDIYALPADCNNVSVDAVNDRLIFYTTCRISSFFLKPVYIINMP